jgi:phage shock protein A
MKSILKKLGQPLMSSLRDLFAPAEDPRLVFGDRLQRERELLQDVQQSVANIAELKQQLNDRATIMGKKLLQLDDEARRALVAGHDELARAIVQRRQLAALECSRLEEQVHSLQAEEQRLALLAQRLVGQIESLSTRQNVVAAQSSAAETRARIAEALASVSRDLGDLGAAAKQAEQEAEQMPLIATALDSLLVPTDLSPSAGSVGDPLARRLNELEFEHMVDQHLALLKSQLVAFHA